MRGMLTLQFPFLWMCVGGGLLPREVFNALLSLGCHSEAESATKPKLWCPGSPCGALAVSQLHYKYLLSYFSWTLPEPTAATAAGMCIQRIPAISQKEPFLRGFILPFDLYHLCYRARAPLPLLEIQNCVATKSGSQLVGASDDFSCSCPTAVINSQLALCFSPFVWVGCGLGGPAVQSKVKLLP